MTILRKNISFQCKMTIAPLILKWRIEDILHSIKICLPQVFPLCSSIVVSNLDPKCYFILLVTYSCLDVIKYTVITRFKREHERIK